MDRKMTLEDLDEMDTNDDGEVDLFEFMSFMLSKMGKVDIEMMNDLKDLFESLDETLSNTIQKADLLLLAQSATGIVERRKSKQLEACA